MIKKLQKKFLIICTSSMLAVLLLVLGIINMISYFNAKVEIFSIVSMISESGGRIPETMYYRSIVGEVVMTGETRYAFSFYSALVDSEGTIYSVGEGEKESDRGRRNLSMMDETVAVDYVKMAMASKLEEGFIHVDQSTYAYQKSYFTEKGMTLCVIMDCTRQLRGNRVFMIFSLYIGLVSLVVVFVILAFFSKKAVAPLARNIESQKQFITNAGHELKTPLAIISANTEVLEMTEGKNEWTESTMEQVKRMTELVSHLVTLSKLQEKEELELTEVDFSEVTEKVAGDFRVLAERDGKNYEMKIAGGRKVKANESGLRELVTILVDNAVKYCTDGGTIRILLEPKGHSSSILTVSNSYPEKKNVDYSRFFERFYREDESHNSEKKGFGIGLSMAERFVEMFKGKIGVHYKDGMIHFTVVL